MIPVIWMRCYLFLALTTPGSHTTKIPTMNQLIWAVTIGASPILIHLVTLRLKNIKMKAMDIYLPIYIHKARLSSRESNQCYYHIVLESMFNLYHRTK